MMIISLVYLLPKREELQKAGPQYVVMGYAGMFLSCFFTLLLALFVVYQMM
jgi:hypothetical protein